MATQIDRLIDFLGSRYSQDTIRNTSLQARNFVAFVGEKAQYSQPEVLKYIDSLIDQGYRAGSIRTIVTALKTFFRCINCPWPFTARELHLGITQDDYSGPVCSPDDVAKLIAGAQRERGISLQTVALATTYGLRANEIARVISAGLDGQILDIQTAKGGRRRHHSIPPILASALTFSPYKISREGIHKVFERVMLRNVRDLLPGEGWHAIRRALVTGLLDAGVEPHEVERFMGWRVARTIFRYYRPDTDQLDDLIYQSHPFLPYW